MIAAGEKVATVMGMAAMMTTATITIMDGTRMRVWKWPRGAVAKNFLTTMTTAQTIVVAAQ